MKKVFLSFSRDDLKAREVLSLLRGKLEAIGYATVAAGEDVSDPSELNSASDSIKGASLIIAFIGEQAPDVLFDVGYSFGLGKKVILVANMAGRLPTDLRSVVAIDYRLAPTEVTFEILRQVDKFETAGWTDDIVAPESLQEMLILKQRQPQMFELISNHDFEEAVKQAFANRGLVVSEADREEDYGFDFRLTDPQDNRTALVEVKKYNPNSKVSISAVQQLLGAVHAYRASAAILICTSDFTDSARGFAAAYGAPVHLWTTPQLSEFCNSGESRNLILDLVSSSAAKRAG
jgi:HJR/Mrr/RecB family endonuclease